MNDETKKKYPLRSDQLIKKALKDVLFTRKVKTVKEQKPGEEQELNAMQKRFGPKPTPAPASAPLIPTIPFIEPKTGDTNGLDAELAAIVKQDTVEHRAQVDSTLRTKPLPQVKMDPVKRSFWGMLKSKALPVTAKVTRVKQEIKTGLTNHQRIKRYNSIHEGGHGAPNPKVTEDDRS